MLTLFFGVAEVRSYADAVRADTAMFGRFFRGMLDEGTYLPPSQFEAMFLSLAHDEADVDRIVRAARAAPRRALHARSDPADGWQAWPSDARDKWDNRRTARHRPRP